MKWSIVIIMACSLALSLWGHGFYDDLPEFEVYMDYVYNLYADCYNFCIDIAERIL